MLLRWMVPYQIVASLAVLMNVGACLAADEEQTRATLEGQFSDLDSNEDGLLDEEELDRLPAGQLQALHANGLPAIYPLPREIYVAAGMAVAEAMSEDQAPEDSEKKNDTPAKSIESKSPEVKVSSSLIMIRNAPRKGHYVPELPAEFNARDKNGDGQIALYEWDRKKYSEFAKLDKNGDGFLTPAELLPKGALKTLYARTAEPAKTGGVDPRGNGSDRGNDRGGDRNRDGSNGQSGDDPAERDARNIFGRLDENKDGSVDETEWSRSRQTRGWLEKSGVTVSLPISADSMVGYIRKARESEGR